MNEPTITRKELYDLVWSMSLRKAADRLGIRMPDVVRICKDAEVPRPPNGYWSKLRHGKAPSRPAFQPEKEGQSAIVPLYSHPRGYLGGRTRSRKHATEKAKPGSGPKSQNPSKPTSRHPLVRQTSDSLKEWEPTYWHPFSQQNWRIPAFEVKVSKAQFPRALKFLDILVWAAESRGISFKEVKRDGSHLLAFYYHNEAVEFSVRERFNGELYLRFPGYYGIKMRQNWRDGTKQRVEDLLDGILDTVQYVASEAHRIHRAEEERRRQREEEERIRKERERQIALENARREKLFQQLDRWKKSRELIEFLEFADKKRTGDGDSAEFDSWVVWARSIARELDPFAGTAPWMEWAKEVQNPEMPKVV